MLRVFKLEAEIVQSFRLVIDDDPCLRWFGLHLFVISFRALNGPLNLLRRILLGHSTVGGYDEVSMSECPPMVVWGGTS